MTKILRHKFVSQVSDVTDGTLARASDWDADHDFWLGYRVVTASGDTMTAADAQSDLDRVAHNLQQAYPATNADWGAALRAVFPFTQIFRPTLLMLLAAATYAETISGVSG